MDEPRRVFVGYDSRQEDAYRVCVESLRDQATCPVAVTPLRQDALRRIGLYRRAGVGEPGKGVDLFDGRPYSTEFSFTRFLVPHLSMFDGWALFCDSDFLWRADVAELFALAVENKAVMCVPHVHRENGVKMDGVPQQSYPRKNWSSLTLWNCGHPVNRLLTVDDVNLRPGSWLHSFGWIENVWHIGHLPEEWNWLEGISSASIDPKAVHFTRGGPWFEGYENVAFADEWRAACSG